MNLKKTLVLKGVGGSRGVARGPVKLIFNFRELDKIRDGDVLVSQMTNPDMVLVMRKCVAIVTDSGGLTSHAAIVSRELGIPCVVGTNSATKLLKEGQLVEVDGTNGIVYAISNETGTVQSIDSAVNEDFKLFGNRLNYFLKPMSRDRPFWPESWEFDWPALDVGIEYQWVLPRPEVIVTPLTNSLIVPALEKIPYVLGISTLGPLYSECHYTVCMRLDKLKKIKTYLEGQLIGMNEAFLIDYKQRLYNSYEEFDSITSTILLQKDNFCELSASELISLLKLWWKTHERFFSLTFFIQSMGDDIVWPMIKEMLEVCIENDDNILDIISILSQPTSSKEVVISGQFNEDTTTLLKEIPSSVRDLIRSQLSESEILFRINKLDEAVPWNKEFTKFTQKWWWMRTRDMYFEVKNSREEMLKFIRSSIDTKPSLVNLSQNKDVFEKNMKYIASILPPNDFKRMSFYIELGRFLNRERDNHHHIWLKNTSMLKELILELAKRLKERALIYAEKDIFFLMMPEVFDIFSDVTNFNEKFEIINAIPNRMIAYTFTTKLKLHQRPGYSPDAVPNEQDEYY